MLLNGHLEIECCSQYNKVIRLLQYRSANRCIPIDWWCIVRELETIIVLLAFNFIPERSHHSLIIMDIIGILIIINITIIIIITIIICLK